MTWTYNPTKVAATGFMKVRLLLGDIVEKDPQLQDEEISFFLSQRNSIYGAAADCCRTLAAKMSREADSVQGELRTMYSSRARNYAARAVMYDNAAITRSGAVPYAGGISIADKAQAEQDTDRVTPQFNLGMEDDFLPVSDVGNETLTSET